MATLIATSPVILPIETGLKREPLHKFRTSDGEPLSLGDLEQYDQDTVFFDIFFDPSNTVLYAVGPPLLNLKVRLLPLTLTVNRRIVSTEIKQSSFRQFILLRAPVAADLVQVENSITIEFNGLFTWRGIVPKNQTTSNVQLTIATQQKNNRIRWLQDYIAYYRNAHQVQRFILYDNGSSYQAQLVDLLPDDVVIVDWPFKHGPIHSHANKFGQVGSMTHTIYRFGNTGYCLNFDIDELLVMRTGNKITDYLEKYSLVRVDQYRVPYIVPPVDSYSFEHFPLREADFYDHAPKYGYKFSDIALGHWHDAVLRDDRWYFRIMTIGYRANYWLRAKSKISQYGTTSGLFRIIERLLNTVGKLLGIRYTLKEDEGYFLHYKGITTQWKKVLSDRLQEPAPEIELVRDEAVVRFFREESMELNPCPSCGAQSADPTLTRDGYQIVRCQRCNLLHVNPMPTTDALQVHYEGDYFAGDMGQGGYDDYTKMQGVLTGMAQRRLGIIGRKHPNKGKILDYGCAAGYFLAAAKTAGWEIAGVELSRHMAKTASTLLGINVVTSLDQLAAQRFDVITLWEVIEHFPQPLETLAALYERLKPGGTLMLSTPNTSHWQAVKKPDEWTRYCPPSHLLFFTAETLTTMLEKSRFTHITIDYTAPLPQIAAPIDNFTKPLQKGLANGTAKPWRLSLYSWRAIRLLAWGLQRIVHPAEDVYTTLEAIATKPMQQEST